MCNEQHLGHGDLTVPPPPASACLGTMQALHFIASLQLRVEMSSLQRLHLSEVGFSLFFLDWFVAFS